MQFGLATFHYDSDTDKFSHRAYNVYVWPRLVRRRQVLVLTFALVDRPAGRGAPDRRFLSQTSCIDFLIGHGFDFNKLFKEGVPFLLPSELDKLREGLRERQENRRRLNQVEQPENLKVRVPEEQLEWLEKQMTAIEVFMKTEDHTIIQDMETHQHFLIEKKYHLLLPARKVCGFQREYNSNLCSRQFLPTLLIHIT